MKDVCRMGHMKEPAEHVRKVLRKEIKDIGKEHI